MSYRSDIDALAARKQALDTEIAERTRERDETARMLAEASEKLRLPVLDDIRVAAPCRESWASMEGDDRVRHCARCDQDVFNLSALTREEAEALIRDKNGELCARYFRRADGTILTKDCAFGVRRRRGKLAVVAGAMATLAGSFAAYQATRTPESEQRVEVLGAMELPPPEHTSSRFLPPDPQLPVECLQYEQSIRAIAQCRQLPAETARAIEDTWHDAKSTWHELPQEAIPAIARACETARDALEDARESLCADDPRPRGH